MDEKQREALKEIEDQIKKHAANDEWVEATDVRTNKQTNKHYL